MSGNALLDAARSGNISDLRNSLDLKGARDENGMTALMLAARNGHKCCVEALIQYEKALTTPFGRTALMYAADSGHADCVRLLVQHESRMQDSFGLTALMLAAFQNRVECVRLLIDASETGLRTHVPYGQLIPIGSTALMIAAFRGHIDVVKLLKEHEAGSRDSRGHDPAWYAECQAVCPQSLEFLESGHKEILLLLQGGGEGVAPQPALLPPSIPKPEPSGSKAEPTRNSCEPPVQVESGQRGCSVPSTECINEAMRNPIQEEKRCSGQETELMSAAQRNDVEAAKEHLDQVRMMTNMGRTALMLAAKHGSLDVAKLLTEKEGKMQTNEGETALMQAAIYGTVGVIEHLLDLEGDMTDKNGWTALMHAAYYGREQSIDILIAIESGKQSSASMKENRTVNPRIFAKGVTALMIAAAKSAISAIEALKDYEDGLKDVDGHDALWYATTYGGPDAIRALTSTNS